MSLRSQSHPHSQLPPPEDFPRGTDCNLIELDYQMSEEFMISKQNMGNISRKSSECLFAKCHCCEVLNLITAGHNSQLTAQEPGQAFTVNRRNPNKCFSGLERCNQLPGRGGKIRGSGLNISWASMMGKHLYNFPESSQ